jgi:myo-inositol 2-dehydrogenase/D-chiro-inositol 1-dehydrogenase
VSDFRIGLIGSGRIGQVHAGSIADTKGATLAWICDPFIDDANALAEQRWGKPCRRSSLLFYEGHFERIQIGSVIVRTELDSLS